VLSAFAVQRGFNIIEIMISLAVIGILLGLGAPGFIEWLQNQQIRAAAEAALNGLQVARAEAVRTNTPVRFQFVSDLSATCTLTNTNDPTPPTNATVNWVVSLRDPTNACDKKPDPANPTDKTNPWIFQSRSGSEGTSGAIVTAVFLPSLPAAQAPQGAEAVTFGPLGNVVPNADGKPSIVKIDMSNNLGVDARRPLRIIVNSGGSTRMCDPALPVANPRACPAWP
jgi:type IV fimbrial biogenesis protein FimT